VQADYPAELVRRQRVRIESHDASSVATFTITLSTPDGDSIANAASVIEDFLMFDDARIATLAERVGFPEFETVEVVRRT
jgi:hypothetical protein